MSWYPDDHTVRDFALQKRQVLCRSCAKLVQRIIGCLTSNPNSTKEKILVGQGVDLVTTYIKGGNVSKTETALHTLLFLSPVLTWSSKCNQQVGPLYFNGATFSYPRRERKPLGDRRSHHLPLKSTTTKPTSENTIV